MTIPISAVEHDHTAAVIKDGRRTRTTDGEQVGRKAAVEYSAYANAKARCNNPNHPLYPWYGGRGIKFSFNSFKEFVDDIGRRPSKKFTLDRINNNDPKGYAPGHVRWATRRDQALNRRPRSHKTTCKHGHDLTEPTNVHEYYGKDRTARQCRACHRERARQSEPASRKSELIAEAV